jgi:2'-5' RNA ligase
MENLYFIAIILPKDISGDITAFKQDFAERYNSKTALKLMPHITLKAPFKLLASSHAPLIEWFHQLSVQTDPFKIEVNNFGSFYNKRSPVIFAHPEITTPLVVLQKEIIRSFHNNYPFIEIPDVEFKFKPHITVAYRDLLPEQFFKAWEVYKLKEYHADFIVNNFHLLQHDGKKWNIIETHSLQNGGGQSMAS